MNSTLLKRPYRKIVSIKGVVFIETQEHDVVVQNLSISGALVMFRQALNDEELEHLKAYLMETSVVDLFIPELQLSGEAEVVRLGKQADGALELALQFKALDCQFGKWPNKRMSYRKNLKDQGRIIFNRKCYRFFSSNASVAGLMIQIPDVVPIKPGTVTLCEFRRLMLNCKVKVVWVQQEGNSTVLGLQYLNIEKERVKGVPHFYSETASEGVSLSHVDDLSLMA